ncbi:hypothetical protein BBW65_04870 [Helicobacter enhydrae]|uniref:Nicotinamide riboside transporter PnuC n=1 Tax=Helicobacter enhydrae TaxID=222136 RepID=A0A1B1U645_9HELI|nr:nicotinamide riboside transporter PnuC [Helicobacter enhydrae]ANV98172.1 hypothetical protein BBW65_04870 [Helicobacter enhydrae]
MFKLLSHQFLNLPRYFVVSLLSVSVLVGFLSVWGGSWGIELFVALLGIWYAFFAGEGKVVCFLFGILYCVLYAYLAFEARLYGDVMLNLFYLPINIVGVFAWCKPQNTLNHKIIIRNLSSVALGFWILLIGVLSVVYAIFLDSINASFAYFNALSVVLQLVAFYLQVRRYVQSYMLVTFANLIAIIIWAQITQIHQENIAQLLNMIVFLLIGIYYWRRWYQESKNQETNI